MIACCWTLMFISMAQLLWRYNKEAVALRIAFFTSARAGGVAHTVLVRDIPGLDYGTLPNRIEDTALRFLPRFVKRRLVVSASLPHRHYAVCPVPVNSLAAVRGALSMRASGGLSIEVSCAGLLLPPGASWRIPTSLALGNSFPIPCKAEPTDM